MPDVSLECASNMVHFRLCVDSCIALRDLMVYLTSNRDLHQPDIADSMLGQNYSNLPDFLPPSSTPTHPPPPPHPPPASSSSVGTGLCLPLVTVAVQE